MVYLRRTFHPVGQGAFYTEQFYDSDEDKVIYNVVYDCGSLSLGIKDQIEREIRNSFHDKKEIDVLFLSHFDDDHVNYVKYLKANDYLENTKVFIPMLAAEEWLGIFPYASNYQYLLSLRGQDGINVVEVSFEEDGDGERDLRNDPVSFDSIEGDVIKSGTPLMPDRGLLGAIWCYTPFNVQFSALIDEFKQKLSDEGLEYDKLRNSGYVIENRGKLKTIYQGLGKKPTAGTAINLNSLLVLSYPLNSDKCEWVYPWGCCRDWGIVRRCWHRGYNGSCLYTGDTSANDPGVWNRIEQMINHYLGVDSKLSLLQVPHHGSENSYDNWLVASPRYCDGFTNFDPYYRQHIFDDRLPMKFAIMKKNLLLITRDYGSRFEEYWSVG